MVVTKPMRSTKTLKVLLFSTSKTMKLHNELPVYKATYDMLPEIFQLCVILQSVLF